jgi:hypothetical protein
MNSFRVPINILLWAKRFRMLKTSVKFSHFESVQAKKYYIRNIFLMMIRFLFLFLCLLWIKSDGQLLNDSQLVQFSGVVVSADSLKPIPYSSIIIKNSSHGTVSDYYGFFSFVAKMKDTVEFGAIGFRKATFIIPDTLTDQRCSMIQILKKDTIMLKEFVVFPWPTKEQFKEAFINLRIPDDDLTRAEKNMEPEKISYLAAMMPMDGSMNFKNYMNDLSSQIYYAGQLRPNTLLDPIKWSKFIQMWQNGEFKQKENKYNKDGN